MKAPGDLGAGELVGGRPAKWVATYRREPPKVNQFCEEQRGGSQLSRRRLVAAVIAGERPGYQSCFDSKAFRHGPLLKNDLTIGYANGVR